MKVILAITIFVIGCTYVLGHGMVLQPINRASRWRIDESITPNFDDNGLFCGGFKVQWEQNGGKCGLCGDNYADPTPRTYEIGGSFGEPVIVEKYRSGDAMDVEVLVTANHKGFFTFKLCNLDTYTKESEQCFDNIALNQTNGDLKYFIDNQERVFKVKLQLPAKLVCKHCVLQWTWTTANSWGDCDDGQNKEGCGPQENFRTCSDISISA